MEAKKATTTKRTNKDKAEVTLGAESGVTLVTSWGSVMNQSDVTATDIQEYRSNVYARGVSRRQRNLIFTARPSIEVYDEDGDPDDELRDIMVSMCDQPEVDLYNKMRLAFDEIFWYGAAFLNPVWEQDGNAVVLKKLRHLPSESFTQQPQGMSLTTYSNVLPGVTIESDEVVFYQLQDVSSLAPVKVENVTMIKEPTEPGLAGMPMILPLVSVLKMLGFAWQAQMQRVNRVGAPVIFVRVSNGTTEDIAYAKKLLKNWGRNTSYVLKSNMELVSLDIKETDSAMQTIEALNQLLIEFFSPASSLTKEGSLIGGSDWGASELLKSYISGIHRWLEDAFKDILQPYLDLNGYEGYTVEIHLPAMSIDRSEIMLKQAQVGFNTRALSVNEIRKRLEAEELDEEGLAKLREEWAAMPADAAPAQGGNPIDVIPPIMNAGEGCAHDDAWYNVFATPKSAEKLMRNDLKKEIDALEDEVMQALEQTGGKQ